MLVVKYERTLYQVATYDVPIKEITHGRIRVLAVIAEKNELVVNIGR
jgi:hypothetical protein